MAGRQRRELFRALAVEGTVADQDRTNMLLRKSCEGRFEIAIGSGIHNNELQARACSGVSESGDSQRFMDGRIF